MTLIIIGFGIAFVGAGWATVMFFLSLLNKVSGPLDYPKTLICILSLVFGGCLLAMGSAIFGAVQP